MANSKKKEIVVIEIKDGEQSTFTPKEHGKKAKMTRTHRIEILKKIEELQND